MREAERYFDRYAEMQRIEMEMKLRHLEEEIKAKARIPIKFGFQETKAGETFSMEPFMSGVSHEPVTRYSTKMELDDGSTITVSMNIADSLKLKPENIDSMFWDVPCRNGGNSAPRTLAQVQHCKCHVCQAACATILKWRMMK